MSESGPALQVRLRQALPIPLDVTLECERGEVLALVGPSGGGKSTVLRCIAGLHRPQEGRVVCLGESWLDSSRGLFRAPQARRTGLVFQSYALFPHLSALANVAIAVDAPTGRERRIRAEAYLARVNMTGLEGRRPAELSGGQRQRVALARALAREPRVLLLDEPFSAVDQVTRRRLQRELAQLRTELALPVVLVTHDLDEAVLLSDRISVLHRGRTLAGGPTAQVTRAPPTAEVAQLLDHRNVFEAEVVRHESDRTVIRWAGLELECPLDATLAPGTTVDWLVPRAEVRMHRQDNPSSGDRENPVFGTVAECVALGDDVQIGLAVTGSPRLLTFSVARPVARRNDIAAGRQLGVSLLRDGIHVMARNSAPED